MAEGLSKKKQIRGGHRSSASRIMNEASEAVSACLEMSATAPNLSKLRQYKSFLQEKLDTLNRLDEEVLELVVEEAVEEEIEQADVFKERMQLVMISIDDAIAARTTERVPTPTTRPAEGSHGPP